MTYRGRMYYSVNTWSCQAITEIWQCRDCRHRRHIAPCTYPFQRVDLTELNYLIQISFCGYKVLNWYERLAWLPVLIVFVVALGVGGKHLTNPPPSEPATASVILSFASTIAGFVITYSPLSSDFTSYFQPNVSRYIISSDLPFILSMEYVSNIAWKSSCIPILAFFSLLWG